MHVQIEKENTKDVRVEPKLFVSIALQRAETGVFHEQEKCMFNEMVYCDGGNEACTIIKLMSRKINMGQSCNDTFFFFLEGEV